MNITARITATLIMSAAAATLAAPLAAATPGHYTRHGDVRVIVTTSDNDCATVTWPRGTTSTVCEVDTAIQTDIVPGDTFGASIISYTGAGVACAVIDLVTGDTIYESSARPGYRADCIRRAR